MYNINEKTALVTGGAKRIGKTICTALAKAGANVVIHYLESRTEADNLARSLREIGVGAWTIEGDLSNRAQAQQLISRAIDLAGPLDILVNNASIFFEDRLTSFEGNALDQNVQINAFAPLVLSREFEKQKREGAIVNCLDSRVLAYDELHASYHLSKRMLLDITKMSAIEFAPNVRVNAVAPGLILPPPGQDESYLERVKHKLPLKRYGSAEQVAQAALFLLTNDFVTGHVIYVDGGRHLKTSVYA